MVSPVDSTVVAMRKKVRRLTASASENVLSTADIDRQLNAVMSQTFPLGIKMDQTRSVYTFYTQPYIDRYPLDVNFNMGVRGPVYVEGIQGSFFKDRQQFYALWPRFPYLFNPPGLSMGTISNITSADPAVVTSTNHGLLSGDEIFLYGIVGTMSSLNEANYTVSVVDANSFQLLGVDSTALAYVSGGTFVNLLWSFTIPGPFLSQEVALGSTDFFGNPFSVKDDGNGNLIYMTTNPVVSVPTQNINPALPGMYNQNTGNPGLIQPFVVGTVNYVSGVFSFNFSTLGAGTFPFPQNDQITCWVSQYQTGRPYSLLFWNNEFRIRPIPQKIHKIEVETYLTPIQFLETTDQPILSEWWQYVAYLASAEILRERQDMEGVANLQEGLKFQEALVLERQAIEELFTPNPTIFNSVTPAVGGVNGIGYFV